MRRPNCKSFVFFVALFKIKYIFKAARRVSYIIRQKYRQNRYLILVKARFY